VSWFTRAFGSTIGKKVLAGLSGLALVGFLIGHLYGNLHIYKGAGALDEYAHHLHEIPGFPLIEIGLLAAFALHIGLVINLTMSNRSAKASRYAVKGSKTGGGAGSLASRTMALSGMTLLVFLVVHIVQLRMNRGIEGGVGNLMFDTLANPAISALYIAGSLTVAWHVYHGIQSAARSLGVNHENYTPLIVKGGAALAVVFAVGFASIPVAVMAGLPTDGLAVFASSDDHGDAHGDESHDDAHDEDTDDAADDESASADETH